MCKSKFKRAVEMSFLDDTLSFYKNFDIIFLMKKLKILKVSFLIQILILKIENVMRIS